MFIKEVYLRVGSLTKSIDFYSSLLGEECIREKSSARFQSGIVLFTEKGWKSQLGLSETFQSGMCLSSTVVLETDEYSRIITNILENDLLPRVLNIDSRKITLVDFDLNMLVIMSSGKDQDTTDDYQFGEKTGDSLSVRS